MTDQPQYQPGWHPVPDAPEETLRWHDGTNWTDQYQVIRNGQWVARESQQSTPVTQVTPVTAPAAKESNTSNALIVAFGIIMTIMLLFVGCAVMIANVDGDDDDGSVRSSTSDTPSVRESAAENPSDGPEFEPDVEPELTPEPTPEPEPEPFPELLRAGDEKQLNRVTVKVHGISVGKPKGSLSNGPGPGEKMVFVDASITNNHPEPRIESWVKTEATLRSLDGLEMEGDTWDEVAPEGTINEGRTIRGEYAFFVPADMNEFTFLWQPGFDKDDTAEYYLAIE